MTHALAHGHVTAELPASWTVARDDGSYIALASPSVTLSIVFGYQPLPDLLARFRSRAEGFAFAAEQPASLFGLPATATSGHHARGDQIHYAVAATYLGACLVGLEARAGTPPAELDAGFAIVRSLALHPEQPNLFITGAREAYAELAEDDRIAVDRVARALALGDAASLVTLAADTLRVDGVATTRDALAHAIAAAGGLAAYARLVPHGVWSVVAAGRLVVSQLAKPAPAKAVGFVVQRGQLITVRRAP